MNSNKSITFYAKNAAVAVSPGSSATTPVALCVPRRRWVFDHDPLKLPPNFKGNVYRGRTGSLLVSLAVAYSYRIQWLNLKTLCNMLKY